ncbi:hypothetical protein [Helicobacter hepaticus]|jgi:hypothetical protein|uniref:Uncharacterized protein n=1 Tax=Helicobacter hepaticus (strain ATCC 51449 / 3B1) TaxID=235279 RepID=Q7VFN9_HELHP|nr:hypothetical protein [Helicobacter hepaticus]AAP78233.1 hypothetical protein HH_1636 [Helicobacter hepaticus ATCC 51449]
MFRFILILVFLGINIYADDKAKIKELYKQWGGIYVKDMQINEKSVRLGFLIDDNCYVNEHQSADGEGNDGMGNFYCSIYYSKDGKDFLDWWKHNIDFVTEPQDQNYATTRIISLISKQNAVIKVYSMEFANDFCNIKVQKQGENITLEKTECKLDGFILHDEVFGTYTKSEKW